MNYKLLLLPALAIVGIMGYGGIARAYDNTRQDQMANGLAVKLGVSEDKVASAFDELHTERQAEMQARQENRLQTLVDEGKLTSSQKEAVIAKYEELQTRREQERQELESWATDQGIDLDVVGPMGMGSKMMHGPR